MIKKKTIYRNTMKREHKKMGDSVKKKIKVHIKRAQFIILELKKQMWMNILVCLLLG